MPFQSAERKQESLLAPLEKRALIWLARRMPAPVNSDHLTALGFGGMIAAGLGYWYARYNTLGLWIVIAALAVNWFGDSLDGTLARVRNRQRPRYGFYVDHILDAFGTLALLLGLAMSGYMSERVALGLIIVYFLLNIEVYLATYTIGKFHMSFWKFSPTELRVLLIAGNLALLWSPVVLVFNREYLLFDVGGVAGIAGMALMAVNAAVRHTVQLYREETK